MKIKTLLLTCIIGCQLCYAQDDAKQEKYSYDERELVGMFVDNAFDTLNVSCNNRKAIKVYDQKLDYLEEYIKSDYDLDSYKLHIVCFLIYNFSLLTGIESESDGDYIGQYKPTLTDIARWQAWLKTNKDSICWYKEKDILYLRKHQKDE